VGVCARRHLYSECQAHTRTDKLPRVASPSCKARAGGRQQNRWPTAEDFGQSSNYKSAVLYKGMNDFARSTC
jgi:hypothetical protein